MLIAEDVSSTTMTIKSPRVRRSGQTVGRNAVEREDRKKGRWTG